MKTIKIKTGIVSELVSYLWDASKPKQKYKLTFHAAEPVFNALVATRSGFIPKTRCKKYGFLKKQKPRKIHVSYIEMGCRQL